MNGSAAAAIAAAAAVAPPSTRHPGISSDTTMDDSAAAEEHLPKSSPVQTVYTEGEVSVLKKAVCLKACRELHTIGALTDSLLPELGVPWEEEPDIGMLIADEFD
jgi:hypothetical protein